MSLKLFKIDKRIARVMFIAAAIVCVAAAWFFIRWNFANAVATRLDPQRPEARLVAEWLTQLAPSDPRIHYENASLLEKTFDAGDLERSLREYETAVSLSPNDYRLWLNLGKSRNLNGNTDGAREAYEKALELAPNYAATQWAYGNFLIRQGSTDDGFAMIADAAAANPIYSRTAVVTALSIFDGNIAEARRVLGDTAATNASLVSVLVLDKRFDEALDAWNQIGESERLGKYRPLGETLVTQFSQAKKFRAAARVYADLMTEGEKPVIGQIVNGGFEGSIKLRDAGLFDWNVADGTHPQVGVSEGQKRSGKYSLSLSFDSFEAAGFRQISQTVAVEPGAEYEFEGFYRFDVKSPASFKWEILDPFTGVLAATPSLEMAGDWTTMRLKFTAPPASDGVIVRLVREGCGAQNCPTTGRINFDDFSLRRL